MSQITAPDAAALDALARLQLAAARLGATVRLHNATPALADLIAFAGLDDVLIVADGDDGSPTETGSVVAMYGQVEQREEIGVDEEVHPGDEPV